MNIYDFGIIEDLIKRDDSYYTLSRSKDWPPLAISLKMTKMLQDNMLGPAGYTGSTCADSMLKYSELFSFFVEFDNSCNVRLSVYDESGSYHVVSQVFKNEEYSVQLFNELKSELSDYEKGLRKCRDCGEKFDIKTELGGWHYAACYYKKCWQNKWARIEANDNHD